MTRIHPLHATFPMLALSLALSATGCGDSGSSGSDSSDSDSSGDSDPSGDSDALTISTSPTAGSRGSMPNPSTGDARGQHAAPSPTLPKRTLPAPPMRARSPPTGATALRASANG